MLSLLCGNMMTRSTLVTFLDIWLFLLMLKVFSGVVAVPGAESFAHTVFHHTSVLLNSGHTVREIGPYVSHEIRVFSSIEEDL